MKSGEYEFKIDEKRNIRLSKPEIIVKLKEFYELKNYQSFTRREWDGWKNKPLLSSGVVRSFGAWADALQKAEIKAQRRGKRDIKKMVAFFKEAWEKNDGIPTMKLLDNYLKSISAPYTWQSYTKHWGGLKRLAKRIVKHQKGEITDAELYAPFESIKNRDPIPRGLRYDILKRDNWQCVKCGVFPKKDKKITLHVDHIIPWSKGGSTKALNLQTLCDKCNYGKKDKDN